ncbi:hypothetical protein JCM10207_009159 [Rhodosporidiobolus poonsookiae]
MTSTAKLVASKVDASYRIVIACDFEADLSDKTLAENFPLKDVPLAGDWSLELAAPNDGVRIYVVYEGPSTGRFGLRVACGYDLFWCDGGVLKLVDSGEWSPTCIPDAGDEGAYLECVNTAQEPLSLAGDDESFDPEGQKLYRFVFELRQKCLRVEHDSPDNQLLANRLGSKSTFRPTPHNFRLLFPKLGEDGASLWVRGALLSNTCSYFKDLLTSGFAEAAPRRGKRARTSGAQAVDVQASTINQKDFEDSDDDTDEYRFGENSPQFEEPPDDLSYREITITQTAFSTYHALIVFLQTGYLRFAPLKSACKPANPKGIATRREFIAGARKQSVPHPVSPKSLYRLVDLLRVPNAKGLAALCLDAIANSLTFDGAAHELFGDASTQLEPIHKVVLAYVVAHWNEVRDTASWKEYAARMKAGEMPEAAGIMMELSEARDEAE